jgi:ADP-dependent NAD(P)H-hydrate dehydratase / NAD(P)H-hydrate epimerase
MMKILLNHHMQTLDQQAMESYGMPGLLLMERAGLAIFEKAQEMVTRHQLNEVLVICGPGNNGGDGMAAARHLHDAQIPVRIYLMSSPDKLKGDTFLNYSMLIKRKVIPVLPEDPAFNQLIGDYDRDTVLIIDAIFGTGLDRTVTGPYHQMIERINEFGAQVLSVDIPSGVHGDTGKIMGIAVAAAETVAFACPKVGNLCDPGAVNGGNLTVSPIGIPVQLLIHTPHIARTLESDDITAILPNRHPSAHKGTFGTLMIIGGTYGYTGAAILAARAAMVSGAGLIKAAVKEALNSIYEETLQEVITVPFEESGSGGASDKGVETILKASKSAKALVAGPGWGQETGWTTLLQRLIESYDRPLVLDADALNLLAQKPDWFLKRQASWVLTPHPGEMSRLTGLSVSDINGNRLEITKNMAKEWNAVVVLKGKGTVIADPAGNTIINTTGNAGMAKAGSGDVLSGIIGSLLAQGVSPFDAAAAACWLHGSAGDTAADRWGKISMSPTNIIDCLPEVFKKVSSQKR